MKRWKSCKKSLVWLLSLVMLLGLTGPLPAAAENGDDPPGDGSITIHLRATGMDGDVFEESDYQVPSGEITVDGHTLDQHTAMGALAYYCQEKNINLEITESQWGLFVYQIGDDPADEGSWRYYVNESSPWVGADEYDLAAGDSLHFVNSELGLYSLKLSLDPESVEPGGSLTATVTYTGGDGQAVPAAGASLYVSRETDDWGNPVSPGDPLDGETDAEGILVFTWEEPGRFFPYAEWEGKSTQYQWPGVSFSVPGLYTTDSLYAGDKDPTLEVKVLGEEFTAGAAQMGNWVINPGDTGLTLAGVTIDHPDQVTLAFSGTAASGTITIQALAGALEGGAASNELSVNVGQNVEVEASDNQWIENGNTVLDALLKYQQDDGNFWWTEDTAGATKGATAQSLLTLSDLAHGGSTRHRLGLGLGAADPDLSHPQLALALERTVNWYRDNHPAPANWEGLPALWGAGEDLNSPDWQTTQTWRHTDPGFGPAASGNQHVHYIFRLLSVGEDPADIWGGRNLFAELAAQQQADGSFGDLGKQIWSIVALDVGAELGSNPDQWDQGSRQAAVAHLLSHQNANGSFGTFSELDYTGWALVALSRHGEVAGVETAVNKALGFLKSRQQDNGGFSMPGEWGLENSNTNAAVISGLVAAGEELLEEETILVQPGTPITVQLKSGSAPARLQTQPEDQNGKPTASLPSIHVEAETTLGTASVSIAPGTSVSGPAGWDGSIQLPRLLANTSVSPTEGSATAVVEVGFPQGRLEFDQPVRLSLPGQAGKSGGYTRPGESFHEITRVLDEDSLAHASAALSPGEAGYINSGDDLVIWTTHFTRFVAYEKSAVTPPPSNGAPSNGGGAGDEPEGLPDEPASVTLSVEARTIGRGDIIPSTRVTLESNDTAYSVLAREAARRGVAVSAPGSGSAVYVEGIAGIYEFDHGPLSGWQYSVNGSFPSRGAGDYRLRDGDRLRWMYTKDGGQDLGADVDAAEDDADEDAAEEESEEDEIVFGEYTAEKLKEILEGAGAWLLSHADFSRADGFTDWNVFALIRSGQQVPDSYRQVLADHVAAHQGEFRLVTHYARMILALAALGEDPSDFAGYNLVEKMHNHEGLTNQGTNGAVFALIALDAVGYQVPEDALWTRQRLVDWILDQQSADGGFSLHKGGEGSASEVDITAMALQALAPYRSSGEAAGAGTAATLQLPVGSVFPDANPGLGPSLFVARASGLEVPAAASTAGYQDGEKVQAAVNAALEWLASQQLDSGGFSSQGVENCESVAQVIIALTVLGMDPQDERFVRGDNTLLDNLLSFARADGGFAHARRGEESSNIATQQALMALTAYMRWLEGRNHIYDLSPEKVAEDDENGDEDATPQEGPPTVGVTMFIDRTTYWVDGVEKEMTFAPFIDGGRTFVPVRFVAEEFGLEADWGPRDSLTQWVSLTGEDIEIRINVGENAITVAENGVERTVQADVAAQIREGRTVLPIRAVGEMLDAQFDWGPRRSRTEWVNFRF